MHNRRILRAGPFPVGLNTGMCVFKFFKVTMDVTNRINCHAGSNQEFHARSIARQTVV